MRWSDFTARLVQSLSTERLLEMKTSDESKEVRKQAQNELAVEPEH
jgi:hypothetical protein